MPQMSVIVCKDNIQTWPILPSSARLREQRWLSELENERREGITENKAGNQRIKTFFFLTV